MRIIAGQFKGMPLDSPSNKDIRPTSDRVRESIFNILTNKIEHDWENQKILDLYAGTGALGFEALSRGAVFAVFVDQSAEARGLIRGHIDRFQLGGRTRLLRRNACDLGPAMHDAPFNMVFADPPYKSGLGDEAILRAFEQGWLARKSLIMIEEHKSAEITLGNDFELLDQRQYGDTQICIFQLDN